MAHGPERNRGSCTRKKQATTNRCTAAAGTPDASHRQDVFTSADGPINGRGGARSRIHRRVASINEKEEPDEGGHTRQSR